jgi:hypothetical protein
VSLRERGWLRKRLVACSMALMAACTPTGEYLEDVAARLQRVAEEMRPQFRLMNGQSRTMPLPRPAETII